MRVSVLLALAAAVCDVQSDEFVNVDAQRRLQRKMEWREARPVSCKDGEQGRSWWCGVTSDEAITIRNAERLAEVAGIAETKQPSERTADQRASIAAHDAVGDAKRTFAAAERARVSKASKAGKKATAAKVPTEFRCRKLREVKDIEKLRYKCVVSESGTGGTAGTSSADADGTPVQEQAAWTPEERCRVYHRWLGQYESGSADEFWAWLAQEHAGFGVLQKLKEHTEAEGAASGKVRMALEKKATDAYRKLSREVHADKLPALCAETVRGMMLLVSDRAKKLQSCVLKPLRCEIKRETQKVEEL